MSELNREIKLLEIKQQEDFTVFKKQLLITYISLKPVNLIKSTFEEVTESPEIKGNIMNQVIGLGTGYLTKRILMGQSRNPLKKLFGVFLQFAVTNVVARHSENVKTAGEKIIRYILKSENNKKKHCQTND